MAKEKIICVRLDPETSEKLEQLARSRGVDKSKLLRALIEELIERSLNDAKRDETLAELDKIVFEAKQKMEEVFRKWEKHCEEHAKEVVARNPHLNLREIKEQCMKNGLILMDLQRVAREYILKIKSLIIDADKQKYYKKVWGLINQYL
jgi:predicted transcriptional regulator